MENKKCQKCENSCNNCPKKEPKPLNCQECMKSPDECKNCKLGN